MAYATHLGEAALMEGEVRVLLKTVTGTTPDQLMFDFALWSSKAVVAFAAKKFAKAVTDVVVEHLSGHKRVPEKVRNLFRKPDVRYAAAEEADGC